MTAARTGPPPDERADFDEARRRLFEESGIEAHTIDDGRWYRETSPRTMAQELGFPGTRAPAWAFPYFDETGRRILVRYRPDRPRDPKRKYAQPKGSGVVPYIHPSNYADGRLRDASKPLVFTEGEKKAALLTQLGYATIGAGGVDGFHSPDRELHDLITRNAELGQRPMVILFDSDAHDKVQVMGAAGRLAHYLRQAGATGIIRLATPPRGRR